METAASETVTIYACKCKVNGKIYIGSTKNLVKRIYTHKHEARKQANDAPNGYVGKKKFYGDVETYGWDSFQWYVIEQDVPIEDRRERENYWIKKYRATDPAVGYNKIRTIHTPELPEDIIYGLP